MKNKNVLRREALSGSHGRHVRGKKNKKKDERNQFVREMKMIAKASIHFLDIDVAIKMCCLT